MEQIRTFEKILELGFLARIRARRALTEPELVDRAVNFANRGTVSNFYKMMEASDSIIASADEKPSSVPGIQATQYRLWSALTAIVAGTVSSARKAIWCQIASGVLPIAEYRVEGSAVHTTYRYEVVEAFAGEEPDGLNLPRFHVHQTHAA